MRLASVLRLALLTLVTMAVLAPTALATTSKITISVTGQLTIEDTDGGHHDITVTKISPDPNPEWLISDMAMAGADITPEGAALLACAEAAPGDDSAWVCDDTNGPMTSLLVDMGHGDDHVNLMSAGLRTSVFGGDGHDTIRGTDFADALNGNSSDFIDGGGGNDYIEAGDGDDNIQGAAGQDSLYGGAGEDLLNAINSDSDTANDCGADTDEIYLDPTGDTQINCENVHGPAAPAAVAPTNTVAPAAPSGEAKVGKEIASTHGTWSGTEPMTFVVQWQRCDSAGTCTAITGATGLTYEITKDDATYQLQLTVQAINSAGTSAVAVSQKTAVVPKALTYGVSFLKPAQGDPPQAKGSKCAETDKPVKVGALFVCYGKAKGLGGTRWELTHTGTNVVTINRAIYIKTTAPVIIDTGKKTIDVTGTIDTGVIDVDGVRRRIFSATRLVVPNASSSKFPIELTNGELRGKFSVAGVSLNALNSGDHIVDGKSFLKVNGYMNDRRMQFHAGARLLEGAVTVRGTYSYNSERKAGATLTGCLEPDKSIPFGAGSRLAELRKACLTYGGSSWTVTADATVLGQISAKANAKLTGNALDAFAIDLAGSGRVAAPFGTYLNGGGISVSGLRSSPKFGGTVTGGWPVVPTGAEVTIKGKVEYDTQTQLLTIVGTGTVTAGGVTLGDGKVDLIIGFGGSAMPTFANMNADVNALGGFITGQVQASISGTGFFASTRATVGFPAGAPITEQANYRIREVTLCHWATFTNPFTGVSYNLCPTVTGWAGDMQIALSHKGVGARGSIGDGGYKVSATAWWIAAGNQWGFDIQKGESKALDFLRRVEAGGKGEPEVFAATTRDTFQVAKGANFLSLQLEGSLTGHVVLRNPKGVVVADTATTPLAENIGFGRDPEGSPRAVLMVPGTVLVPGTWSVEKTGSPTFTKVTPVIVQPTPDAQVTAATPVGMPANATRLTSGVSRLRITWAGPAGLKVGLRATNATGDISVAIKGGLASSGSFTWLVPRTWAGPLRIEAVTDRSGVPTSAATFPKAFTVVRPVIPAPAGVRLVRRPAGKVLATWRRSAGATGYDLEIKLVGTRRPIRLTSTKTTTTLALLSGGRIQVRVRGVSELGLPGKWSSWTTLAPAPKPKPRPLPRR